MKENVNFGRFVDAFRIRGLLRKENFSYKGLQALFDYLEQYEEDTGEEMELDVIGLCCEYAEYESLKDIQKDYSEVKDLDDLRDNTIVIEFDGGIIIQQF